jgi:hypothetical protein
MHADTETFEKVLQFALQDLKRGRVAQAQRWLLVAQGELEPDIKRPFHPFANVFVKSVGHIILTEAGIETDGVSLQGPIDKPPTARETGLAVATWIVDRALVFRERIVLDDGGDQVQMWMKRW